MKKFLLTMTLLWVIGIAAHADEIPNDEIWYEASEKLPETTTFYDSGLHTNAFNVSISSHTFSDGKGGIKFNGDVTSIGEDAFSGCSGMTSVTIPNSVTSIGEDAFSGCKGLTSVTIPNSVTSIGSNPFRNCSGIETITVSKENTCFSDYGCNVIVNKNTNELITGCNNSTIPNSVTSIGEYAFCNCSGLTSVTIPNSVTSIGGRAFYGCSSLTSVTIPTSVTSIGSNPFLGCSGIETITVSKENTCFSDYGCNVIVNKNTNELITGCNKSTIPNSVTSIGKYAFYYCSGLTSVTIPNSVSSIGNSAFYNCSGLTSVTIPNSVSSIGADAFSGCSNLTSVTIPDSVTSIGNFAFSGCSGLTSVTIPNSVTSINWYAFSGCSNVKQLIFEEGTKTIIHTGLTSVTSVTIPTSVTSIGEKAFYNCSGLTSVTIPNSVTSIGEKAFYECSSLTSVAIGNSVSSIENYAFSGCSNVKQLIFAEGTKTVIHTGLTSVTSVIIPNSVTSIGDWAFSGCSGLTSVIIPNSVTSIGDWAFSGCSGLTSVTIPNSVTYIRERAFRNCSGLTSVTIPNSVTSIGDWAFEGCSDLTSVIIGNSVTSIGEEAFAYCSSLKSITIPNSVTSIGEMAFYYCNPQEVNVNIIDYANNNIIPDNISASTWHYYHEGKKIEGDFVWPNDVETISNNALYKCADITSVTIPNSVTSIGGSVFRECVNLADVTVEWTNILTIRTDVFNGVSLSNAILRVPAGTKELYRATNVWKDFDIIVEKNVNITFADENVEQVCVSYWDTDKDGKLSEEEAVAVKSLEGVFKGNTAITSFKELSYFARVSSFVAEEFSGCSTLMLVSIPDKVTTFPSSVFSNCGFTTFVVPDNIATIDELAFSGCDKLTSVTLSPATKGIGNQAFAGCTALTSFTTNTNNPSSITLGEDVWKDINIGLAVLYVPNLTRKLYQSANAWKDFGIIVEVEIPNDEIKYIANKKLTENTSTGYGLRTDAFNTSILSHTFSSGFGIIKFNGDVTSIGEEAFAYCSGLKSITIPNSVTSIGAMAFAYCSSLKSITIPNSVTSIGEEAFERCSGLTSVIIGNSVTSIGAGAFYYCSGLKSVTIPNSVTSIEGSVFYSSFPQEVNVNIIDYANDNIFPNRVFASAWHYYYDGKKIEGNYVVPNNVDTIGSKALYNCTDITSVTIPNSVTNICSSAFSGCSGLTSVSIPDSVTSIGNSAFSGCTGLTSIKVAWSRPLSIESSVFENVDKSTCVLYVPKGTASMYMVAPEWIKFTNIVEYGGAVESVSLNKSTSDLIVGENLILTATVLPDDAEEKSLIWTSSDSTIATVINGVVTGLKAGTATITATTTDGTELSASCVVNVVASNVVMVNASGKTVNRCVDSYDDFNVKDSYKSLAIYGDVEEVNIAYTRNFTTSGIWQAWYVPFDVDYDDMSSDYEVAKILGVLTDEEGKPYIAFGKMTSGMVKANTPYVVKAKTSGDITTETCSTLYQTGSTVPFAVQSTLSNFTFGGVYAETTNGDKGWYALNNDGNFQQMGEEVYLRPFRIYMTITPREDNPYGNTVNPGEVKMMVIGDDATDIDTIGVNGEQLRMNSVNLAGQVVDGSFKGIVIRDGKKYLVR